MPLFLCCALLSGVGRTLIEENTKKSPTSISKTLKVATSVKEATLFFTSLCSFSLFLCKIPVLKLVLSGRVNKSRVVHPFSHSSIKQKLCNLQKSVQQFMPLFLFEVPLTSGRLGCKWFVHSPSACLKLQDGGTFKEIGNAFQVKGELANVMT